MPPLLPLIAGGVLGLGLLWRSRRGAEGMPRSQPPPVPIQFAQPFPYIQTLGWQHDEKVCCTTSLPHCV